MSAAADGLAGLREAAARARAGEPVAYVENGLRAGAPFLTESFLTPFRFNLGRSLVHRAELDGAELRGAASIEPDLLLAVGPSRLGRAPVELPAGASTVWEAVGGEPPERRGLLAALAVLVGIDPDGAGSGERLRTVAAALGELVVVRGGNGMVPAALVDAIVAAGGTVVEGAGVEEAGAGSLLAPSPGGLGVSRFFVGLRGAATHATAFATAVGFDDEQSLRQGLDGLRAGTSDRAVGFVVSNAHLDPSRPGDPLRSIVWQGHLPERAGRSRDELTAPILAAAGIDERDVVFRLLWLPEETGESLS